MQDVTKYRFLMSYQDDFERWKDLLESLPLNQVKLPNQPIYSFAASTETLAVDANEDRDILAAAGLDVSLIDDLVTLSGALRHCQAVWMSEYRARQEAQKEWLDQSPAAFGMRDELLHHFSFAYRKDDNVLKKVMRIREGETNADMVQDLIELAVLGEKYPEPLSAINFDPARLEQARTASQAMAELLAASNGAAGETSANKLMRDKAFTLLLEKESGVREFGRYVFWKNEEKLAKYYRP